MLQRHTVVLTPFKVRVKKHRDDEFYPLDQLPGGQSFFHTFRQFINATPREGEPQAESHPAQIDRDEMTALWVLESSQSDPNQPDTTRWVDMFFEAGEYGKAGTLLDVETQQSTRKGPNIADLLPFYARLDIRHGQTAGLLVVQEYGRPTVASELKRRLRGFFEDNADYAACILKIEPIVPYSYIRMLSRGQVKKMRFWRKLKPTDTVDALVDSELNRSGYLELVVHSPRGSGFSFNLNDWLQPGDSARWSKFLTVEENPEYDKAKVEIEYAGKRRTLDFGRASGLLPYVRVDITEDVGIDDDGHPTRDGVRSAVEDYMRNLHEDEGWI